MCGIVGYVGHRRACDVVLGALRRMEYRGYDSAGVALVDGRGTLTVRRRAGRLANLEDALDATDAATLSGHCGVGHTRWATHGRPTDRNAHPHSDAAVKIAVVHNGIIENFATLRGELEAAGVNFTSDTDTEVAVHLVAHQYNSGDTAGDFVASALAVGRRLEVHFTLVLVNAEEPRAIVAASLDHVGTRRRRWRDVRCSDVAAWWRHCRTASTGSSSRRPRGPRRRHPSWFSNWWTRGFGLGRRVVTDLVW